MGSNVSTAREALMAELLQDVDAIVRRFEQADEALSGKIEKATTDAAGKAFLAAKLNWPTRGRADRESAQQQRGAARRRECGA